MPTSIPPSDRAHYDPTRTKSVAVIRFLQEFARLRSVVKREIDEYEDHLWFSDIPAEQGCFSRARDATEDQPADLWLQVKKAPEPKVPSLTPDLNDWVDPKALADSSTPPTLRERIVRQRALHPGESEPPPAEEILLTACPQVTSAWQAYLARRWQPWADMHRRWKRIHEVYAKLFSIYQAQVKLGEEFELVLGLGCLYWRTPTSQTVKRHLLTAKGVLQFDANRGIFSVTAPADGAKIQLELDMLDAGHAPTTPQRRQIDELLAACDNDPWDRSTTEPVLRALVHSIDNSGAYDDALSAPGNSGSSPRVQLSPAIILRKRSNRGYLAILETIGMSDLWPQSGAALTKCG